MLFVARGFQWDKSTGSSGKERRSWMTCAAGELKNNKQNQAEFVQIAFLFPKSLRETVPSASEQSHAIYKRH